MVPLLRSIFISIFLFSIPSLPHGFDKSTLIKTGRHWQVITQVCNAQLDQNISIASYGIQTQKPVMAPVTSAGKSTSNCFIKMRLNDHKTDDIICTPSQEFYSYTAKQFMPAYALTIDDALLSKSGTLYYVTHIELIKKPLTVYSLEIGKTHTYFVSRYNILTHNMIIPWALSAGLGISFGSGAASGGILGGFFGPITFAGGLICGGVIGIAIKKLTGNNDLPAYKLSFNTDLIDNYIHRNSKNEDSAKDAQAPGKPTESDGYIPPKNWDGKKVKHPETGQIGYPDNKKGVWVPTGHGPLAHRGPHWDVIDKNGNHKNVLPKIKPLL